MAQQNKQQSKYNNVTEIETHYTKEQRRQFSDVQQKIIFRRRRMTAVFVFAALLIAFLTATIVKNLQQISQLEKEYSAAITEQTQLNERKEVLTQEVELLNDPDYLAKLARQKLLITREGETVYYIPKLEKELQQDNQ